jgi:hypothetical protein
MGFANQVAVVKDQEACSGFSLRRLASSGDTLVGLPVLRQQEKLELGQCLTEPAVSGDERVDSLHLACCTDRRGLASKLHAPSVQLVHALEISDELWGQNVPLVAITLATDQGLETGGLEDHWLVPSLAQLVAGAQLLAEQHLDADLRGKDLAQHYGGRGNERLEG